MHITTIWPSNCSFQRNGNLCSPQIYQKLETIQLSFNRWVSNIMIWNTTHKKRKELLIDITIWMNLQSYAEWKKPIPKGYTLPYNSISVRVRMLSPVQLFATPWAVTPQAPLPMGFSRWEYWRGLPLPPPGDLPRPGIEPVSLVSPALEGGFFTTAPPGKPS